MRVLIAAFLLAVMVSPVFAMGERPTQPPPFTLPDLSGQSVSLADYKDRVIFLNFWATWCPPCREEMPSLQKLHEKLKGKNFIMLAVALDEEGKAVVKPFVEKGGYSFKVLLDPDGRVASRYQVWSIPTTFIINKEGKIVRRIVGSRDWAKEIF